MTFLLSSSRGVDFQVAKVPCKIHTPAVGL